MTTFTVKVNDIKKFRGMLEKAKGESSDAQSQMAKYFGAGKCDSEPTLYESLMEKFDSLWDPVGGFYNNGTSAIESISNVLKKAVGSYQNTDLQGATKLDEARKEHQYGDLEPPYTDDLNEVDPEDPYTVDSGSFKYHNCDSPIPDPSDQTACESIDPESHFSGSTGQSIGIDLGKALKDKGLLGQLNGIGIDVEHIVKPFRGNWEMAYARIRALEEMTRPNSSMAENIVAGSAELNETWKGHSAHDGINVIKLLGENLVSPNFDLSATSDDFVSIIKGIDELAEEVASALAAFLLVADSSKEFYPDYTNNSSSSVLGSAISWGEDMVGTISPSAAGSMASLHEIYWPLRWTTDLSVSILMSSIQGYDPPAKEALDKASARLKKFKRVDSFV